MPTKVKDCHAAKSGLQPSYARDNFGLYISISCGSISGQLYDILIRWMNQKGRQENVF